jgi:hypothetical protein
MAIFGAIAESTSMMTRPILLPSMTMSKKYRGFEDGGRDTIGPSISVCCDGGVAAISDLWSIAACSVGKEELFCLEFALLLAACQVNFQQMANKMLFESYPDSFCLRFNLSSSN